MSQVPSTLVQGRMALVDPKTGMPTKEFIQFLQGVDLRVRQALDIQGRIAAATLIQGRAEGIGTTVSGLATTGDINAATKVVGRAEGLGVTTANLDATGKLTTTDAIAADGTGSPLTGGKRGAIALDVNNRLSNSFRGNAVNVSNAPTGSNQLSNDGVSHVITIGAGTNRFAPSSVSYNAGTVDPGVFGTFYVYADDPTFAGGAVTYQFTTDPSIQTAAEGRIPFGKIITVGATPSVGGGTAGGGGRGYAK